MDQNPEITPGNTETNAADVESGFLEDENGQPLTDDRGEPLEL